MQKRYFLSNKLDWVNIHIRGGAGFSLHLLDIISHPGKDRRNPVARGGLYRLDIDCLTINQQINHEGH